MPEPLSVSPSLFWHTLLTPLRRLVPALLLVEGLLHVPPVRQVLPTPSPHYQPAVAARLRLLDRLLAKTDGRLDVLFVGSSVVGAGLDAGQFNRLVEARTGVRPTSFNAWLSGLNPDPVRLYVEHCWLPRVRPRVLVQGIRYAELRANMPAQEYSQFKHARLELAWLTPGWCGRARAWALNHVMLWRFAGFLPEYLRDFEWPPNAMRGRKTDCLGDAVLADPTTSDVPQRLPTDVEAREIGYEVTYVDSVDAANMTVGFSALARIRDLCRRAGIDYVLVNMPEHPARFLRAANGRELYALYLERVRTWCSHNGVRFVDPTDGRLDVYGDRCYSFDHFHLNKTGRERLTPCVAEALADLFEVRDEKGREAPPPEP